jgi:hypothetical protein
MLKYACTTTGRMGLYKNYGQHARCCPTCPLQSSRQQQQKKKNTIIADKAKMAEATRSQEPYASWSAEEGRLEMETGASPETFDLVLRSTADDLTNIHGTKKKQAGSLLLTAANLLLLYLVFLRQKLPKLRLNKMFEITHSLRLVRQVANIVAPVLEQYVQIPRTIKHKVNTGLLKGAAYFVDTSDTSIPRPGRGQLDDRKLYYFFKKGGSWAIKWQASIGMDGRIWEHGKSAEPGKISDKHIYNESKLPQFHEATGLMGIGDSHYVRCVGMFGSKKGSKQSVEYATYNEDIEYTRAVVENLNSRAKNWNVLEFWNLDRHDLAFFTQCLGSVCGLLNLEIAGGKPIRANLRTLLPREARIHHDAKKRKREMEEAKAKKAEGGKRRKKSSAVQAESDEESESEPSESKSEPSESEEEYHEIEKIVDHRGKGSKRTYRVRWLAPKYNHPSHDRWMPADRITSEALDDYKKLKGI